MNNPKFRSDIGIKDWYETTQEYHGVDREFSCDNGSTIVSVGGKGKFWDIFHGTRGNIQSVARYLSFEEAIARAEVFLDSTTN